jgi:CxxC-x17-CxxC domain-containing protein
MKKFFKRKEQEDMVEEETDVVTLLQQIKQQLIFLEKKVDALSSSQPQERRPERSFGHDRHDRGDRDGGFSNRGFKAICAECGQSCEIPFKPSGDRPVYCRDCFSKREGGSSEGRRDSRPRGSFGPDRNSRPRFGGDKGGFGKKPFGFRKKRY